MRIDLQRWGCKSVRKHDMMRNLLIIIGITFSISGLSQINSIPDSGRVLLFPELTKNLKTIDSGSYNFQYRVWCRYESIPPEYSLFVLNQIDESWHWQLYKTRNFEIAMGEIKEDTLDSKLFFINSGEINHRVYTKYFVKNNFQSLPSEDSLRGFKNSDVFISDCSKYYFELIAKNKYRSYEYYCPLLYFEYFQKIPEFRYVNNILKFIDKKNKQK
jgi:hypothetical protein